MGPGPVPLPSLLSWSCLVPLLCGHNVPASDERENPSLSQAGRFRCLFRVYSVLLRAFPMGLRGAELVCGGGVEVRCVWCVVYQLVPLWVSHFRCRFVGRVATLIRLLVTGVLRVRRQWSGRVPREPCRQVAPGRVGAGLGAEDFQGGGILFGEMCPCP